MSAALMKTEDAPPAPAPAKKASAQWNLRMKMPEEFPNIAKFSDEGVKWDKAVPPIKMYFKEEEIKEDEDQEEKDAAAAKQNNFFKKKKGQFRRKRFKKQTALYLEDSTPKIPGQSYEGINYEGQVVNLATAEYESAQTYKYRLAQQAKEEMLFKYVLLQFVKKPDGSGGSVKQEINVIPVGDMFNMKKALMDKDQRQMTLTEAEQQFMEEERRKKSAFARFGTITGKLEASDASAAAAAAMEKDHRGGGKAGGRKEGNYSASSSSGVGGFEVYGKGKGGRGGGGGGGDDHDDVGVASLLGENGEDLEETRKFDDEFHGDYAARPADDEEGQVDVEQANLNDMVDDEIANSAAHMYEDEEDGDSEEEDEEEEEKKKREAEEAAAAKERALNSDVIVFDDNMEHTLSEARKVLELSKAPVASSSSSSSSFACADSTTDRKKRGREEGVRSVAFSDDATGSDPKKGRTSYTVAGGAGSGTAARRSSGASSGGGGSSGYELTNDGVRKYIIDRGGRVAIQDISDVFMPAVKEYSAQQVAAGVKGGKKAGKAKFLKIVDVVATAIEDPLLGPALVLK